MTPFPNALPGRHLRSIGMALLRPYAAEADIAVYGNLEEIDIPTLRAAAFTSYDCLGTDWRAGFEQLAERSEDGAHLAVMLPSRAHTAHFGVEHPSHWLDLDGTAAAAGAAGFTCLEFIPCGLLTGDDLPNLALAASPVLKPHAWRRLLSWLDQDDALFELAALLQDKVLQPAGPALSERGMLLLKKGGEPASPKVKTQPADALLAKLAGDKALHAQLEALLPAPRCGVLLYLLWSALWPTPLAEAALAALPEAARTQLTEWRDQWQADHRCLNLARGWRRLPGVAAILDQGELETGACADYRLLVGLLANRETLFGSTK